MRSRSKAVCWGAAAAVLTIGVAFADRAAGGVSSTSGGEAPHSGTACQQGAYRSSTGDGVLVTSRSRGFPHSLVGGRGFRYLFLDGRRDWVESESSPLRCGAGMVLVTRSNGAVETWPRVEFRKTPTRFTADDGTKFVGLLVEPVHPSGDPPLVVLGHGSERSGVVSKTMEGEYALPYVFGLQGISTLVYDKRGTGESGGDFTMNFQRLARDMVAASGEARRLAAGRFGRFGLWGGSQGGWVAPLAATETPVDFVVVSFGLALSMLEEDAEEVFLRLRENGYGEDVIAKARRVTDATSTIVASHYRSGFEQLAQVRKAYGHEPWFRELEGEFTEDVLESTEAQLRRRAGENELEIMWRHDGVDVLRRLPVPLLWILAEKDRVAPAELTLERLRRLQREGKPIRLAVFPDTDHGMLEFVQAPNGKRTHTRITEGYYRLMGDWIKESLSPPYGAALFHTPMEESEMSSEIP